MGWPVHRQRDQARSRSRSGRSRRASPDDAGHAHVLHRQPGGMACSQLLQARTRVSASISDDRLLDELQDYLVSSGGEIPPWKRTEHQRNTRARMPVGAIYLSPTSF